MAVDDKPVPNTLTLKTCLNRAQKINLVGSNFQSVNQLDDDQWIEQRSRLKKLYLEFSCSVTNALVLMSHIYVSSLINLIFVEAKYEKMIKNNYDKWD